MTEQTFKESFKVAADQLVEAVKKIVHEGNVRRVVIKQEGRTVVEFPMTVGVVGTVFAPILAAVGALAAVVSECTIEVEARRLQADDKEAAELRPDAIASGRTRTDRDRWIGRAVIQLQQQPGREKSERHPVAAVPEREQVSRVVTMRADVRQAIRCRCE